MSFVDLNRISGVAMWIINWFEAKEQTKKLVSLIFPHYREEHEFQEN